MVVFGFRVVLFAVLVGWSLGKECPTKRSECLFSIDTLFADVVLEAEQGAGVEDLRRSLASNPAGRAAFCTMKYWQQRSAMCGACTHYLLLSTVPTAATMPLLDKKICIRLIGIPQHAGFDAVYGANLPLHLEVDCTSNASLSGKVVFINEAENSGCGLGPGGGLHSVRSRGARVAVVATNFHSHRAVHIPPEILPHDLKPEESTGMVAFSALHGGVPDSLQRTLQFPLVEILKEAERNDITVHAQIISACEGASGGVGAGVQDYAGDSTPLLTRGVCSDAPMELQCNLFLSDGGGRNHIACLFEPDLLPLQRSFLFAHNFEVPSVLQIIYIDFKGDSELCFQETYEGLNQELRGAVIAISPPQLSAFCAHTDIANFFAQNGAIGVIFLTTALSGSSQSLSTPIAVLIGRDEGHTFISHFRNNGVIGRLLNETSYTAEVTLSASINPVSPNEQENSTVSAPTIEGRESWEHVVLTDPWVLVCMTVAPIACMVLGVRMRSMYRGGRPTAREEGIPLCIASTLLSVGLGLLLTIMTVALMHRANSDASGTQEQNENSALRFITDKEERHMAEHAERYLRGSLVGVEHSFITILLNLRATVKPIESWIAVRHGGTTNPPPGTYDTPYEQFFFETLNAAHNHTNPRGFIEEEWSTYAAELKTLRGHSPEGFYQIFTENGLYWDDSSTRSGDHSGTFLSNIGVFNDTLFNPKERLYTNTLPITSDVFEFFSNMDVESSEVVFSQYQLTPLPTSGWYATNPGPMLATVSPIFMEGRNHIVAVSAVSTHISNLASQVADVARSPLLENPMSQLMAFMVYNVDGVLLAAGDTTVAHQPYHVADRFGRFPGGVGMQCGYVLPTLFSSGNWVHSTTVQHLLAHHGSFHSDSGPHATTVRFNATDYPDMVRTEWLWLPLEKGRPIATEISGHMWDVLAPFEAQRDTLPGVQFDGTDEITVLGLLTTRVPRVAATKTTGTPPGWQSKTPIYNKTDALWGIPDVIFTERSLGASSLEPAYREQMFHYNSYSVSLWVRAVRREGILITDSLTQNANLRFNVDGSAQVALTGYGCRTEALNFPLRVWVFLTLVVQFEGAGHCTVYKDGNLAATAVLSRHVVLPDVWGNVTIGYFFRGHLQDLRVHNRSLSVEAVKKLMVAGDARYVPDKAMTAAVHTVGSLTYTVVLEYEAIVKAAVENARLVHAFVSEQGLSANEALRQQHVVSLAVIGAAMLISTLAFVWFNTFLTRPVTQLSYEILRVSQMEVDELTLYERNSSMLREINTTRTAMNALVANMRTYKSFMPLTMQEVVHNADPERLFSGDEEEMAHAASDDSSDASHSTSDSRNALANVSFFASRAEKALAQPLLKKRMAFVASNVVRFHDDVLTGRHAEMASRHATYVGLTIDTAATHKGLPETFSGDRVLITFNGTKSNASYRESAGLCAMQISAESGAKLGLKLTLGVTGGVVQAGHIGTGSMKRYSCLGPCVSWAFALERYARWRGLRVVTDISITDSCPNLFDFRHHSIVRSPKSTVPEAPLIVIELRKGCDVAHKEWMYQLEESALRSGYGGWNNLVMLLLQERWDDASTQLQDPELEAKEEQRDWVQKMLDTHILDIIDLSHY